jgi:hypothetical protein
MMAAISRAAFFCLVWALMSLPVVVYQQRCALLKAFKWLQR